MSGTDCYVAYIGHIFNKLIQSFKHPNGITFTPVQHQPPNHICHDSMKSALPMPVNKLSNPDVLDSKSRHGKIFHLINFSKSRHCTSP